ncbi:hypothetical protein [Pedobacter sp. GR22-10]|nr:hypothetical protein [Pedobacter sp. GR22-10]MCX2431272.1 hypothetical protein [Pedobacter sp. GR22-10]
MKITKATLRQSEVNVSLLLLFINGKRGKAKKINQTRFSKTLLINNSVLK